MIDIDNIEELPLEQQKKAINLQDLVYIKKYIDDRQNHYEDSVNTKVQEMEGEISDTRDEIDNAVHLLTPFNKTIFLYDYQNSITPEGTGHYQCESTSCDYLGFKRVYNVGSWDNAKFLQTLDKTKLTVGSEVRITVGFGSGSATSARTLYTLKGRCIRLDETTAFFTTDIIPESYTTDNNAESFPIMYLDLGYRFNFYKTNQIDNSSSRTLDYLKIEI